MKIIDLDLDKLELIGIWMLKDSTTHDIDSHFHINQAGAGDWMQPLFGHF